MTEETKVAKTRKPRVVSDENKTALIKGRQKSRTFDAYLNALKNKDRFKKMSEEEVDKLRQAIAEYDEALENPRLTGMARVRTAQAKRDTEKILESLNNAEEFKRLEEYFIANAREFSILKGIEYDSWREASVPVRTLNKAGIFAPRHPRDLIEISSSSESDEHEAE